MTALGILVVQSDWRPGAPAIIDKTTYQHHGEAFQPGTRFLVYVREPVDAIVAESEVTGAAFQSEANPDIAASNQAMQANEHVQQSSPVTDTETSVPRMAVTGIDQRAFEIPYQLAQSRIASPKLHLDAIQARLGSDFSVFDEEWIPLTEAQYNTLIEEWERNKS
jgi:hypothetical protein